MRLKNLFCIAILILFVFAVISLASATDIVIDTAHHHLGDDIKEELTPGEPEGLVYTATFNLDSTADVRVRSAELTLTTKSVVTGPTDEFLDKVYLNEMEIGTLNDYIPAQTPDDIAVDIAIPIQPGILKSGMNTIEITSGSNAEGSNYDDFEFYNLVIVLTETELITLEPPLKVAWTYELRRLCPDPSWMQPISIIAENVIYLGSSRTAGQPGIKAIDANTGELLWSKEWGADLAYKDGFLFAVHSANIDALDAKTGKMLWSKEYPELKRTPVILGNTLFVSTPDDRYVFAIGTENGDLKWKYELNITGFGTDEGRSHYHLSSPAVSENIVVFRYYASHSNYTEPIEIKPGEPEPELEKTIKKKGLIALDAKTGEVVWEYAYAGEVPFFKPFIYKDLVYNTLGHGNIIALSVESGEEVWKEKVGTIAAVKNGKLFVDSDKPLILNASTGEILKEYSYSNSKLRFSSSAITDKFVYSTSGNKIQAFDLNTGELVWTGGRIKGYAVSVPTVYKDKLYLTSVDGKLYAFEHGTEPFAIETIHIYLATLGILFLLIGAIGYRKRSTLKNAYLEGELQKNFKFSAIIAIIIGAFGLIYSFIVHIVLLLLLIGCIIGGIITGTLVGLRTKNKALIGVTVGATPYIIVAISLLYVLIVEEYYHGTIQEGIALGLLIGFVFSLIVAVIAGIIGGVLGYVLRKK